MKLVSCTSALTAVAVCVAYAALPQQPAAPAPMIKRGATMKISDHAYVILDDNVGFVPNVGIVVGERATLIVDTGMGPDNGAIVLEEARKLSNNTEFYLTATHFHPEHDLGATAFPASAKMIRWRGQQAETDEQGAQTIERFSGFSPAVATLLSKASYRKPDTVFDDEMTLDLGGVHVRLSGVGPAHTRGDTVMYVEEDKVLLTGDVVMPVFPAASAQAASIEKWLASISEFQEFAPRVVVPAHGRLIDAGTLARYREYLTAVQTQTRAAKRQVSRWTRRRRRSLRRWRSSSAISHRRAELRPRAESTPRSKRPIAKRSSDEPQSVDRIRPADPISCGAAVRTRVR